MSGDIFGYHNLGDGREEEGATGVLWVEARDATEPPTVQRTAPHNQELSSPKCQ